MLNMVKGQRSRGGRAPTQKVWRRIFLKQWREKLALSQEKLAEKSGISTGQISLIESGQSGGSPESLEKLADALGIEVGELLDIQPGAEGSVLRVWVKDSDRERIERVVDALKDE